MIPILYEANETAFRTNGIGRLADAISCEVTEELNGEYELQMVYPVTGEHFSELECGRLIMAKSSDTAQTQPFRIYRITKPLSGRVAVYAQHISYDLSGIPVAPFYATGIAAALTGLVTNSMVDHPYTVWTDFDNEDTPYRADKVRSFRACLGGEEGSILDSFRVVEYEFDRFTVKAHRYRGADYGVSIRYGKNLTDITHETSNEKMYTGVIAQWVDDETATCVTSDIQLTPWAQTAPAPKIYMLDASGDFEEQPTVTELNNRALKFISDNSLDTPKTNIKISFVALWQTEEYRNVAALERVSMGDTVHVYFSDFGVNATAKVIKTSYDTLAERYLSIELGEAKSNLAKTLKQATDIKEQVSSLTSSIRGVYGAISRSEEEMESTLQQALIDATNVLTGGTGGYVVIHRNADGQPNEILIMDQPSEEEAINVLKINNQGIGGSTTGVNGIVNMAVLIDGRINASQITTGVLNGRIIEAGTILTSALEVYAQDAVAGVNQYFQFLSDGLHVGRDGADYSAVFSNLGMRVVNSSNQPTLVAEEDSVTANNLTAETYLRITGALATARFQTYHDNVDQEDMFGCYWEAGSN